MEEAIHATWSDRQKSRILAEIFTELNLSEPTQHAANHFEILLLGRIRQNRKRAEQGDALADSLQNFNNSEIPDLLNPRPV